MTRDITLPLTRTQARELHAGDTVYLSGVIYTARDRAHARLCRMIEEDAPLPVSLEDAVIYYCGPCPAPEGHVIGSCGPTSATRMDPYAPLLFDKGVRAVIAKGPFGPEVEEAIIRNDAVYLCAAGGAGALLSSCVRSVKECAFPEFGTESIKQLVVEKMPLIVGIDACGSSLFRNPSSTTQMQRG